MIRSGFRVTQSLTRLPLKPGDSCRLQASVQTGRGFHASVPQQKGFDDFFDVKNKPDDVVTTGRAWTVTDLRRKSFDDLHKLWFVLYKERNLLLSEREKTRRGQRPVLKLEENRYEKVKRSMAGIKVVLNERKRIQALIDSSSSSSSSTSSIATPLPN